MRRLLTAPTASLYDATHLLMLHVCHDTSNNTSFTSFSVLTYTQEFLFTAGLLARERTTWLQQGLPISRLYYVCLCLFKYNIIYNQFVLKMAATFCPCYDVHVNCTKPVFIWNNVYIYKCTATLWLTLCHIRLKTAHDHSPVIKIRVIIKLLPFISINLQQLSQPAV